MRNAYVITATDYGDNADGKTKTLGVYFDRTKAQEALNKSMDSYKKAMGDNYFEDELSIEEKGGGNGCEWNIEKIGVAIPLTPLQVSTLTRIAADIVKGEEGLACVSQHLSAEENLFLRSVLATYNKEEGK